MDGAPELLQGTLRALAGGAHRHLRNDLLRCDDRRTEHSSIDTERAPHSRVKSGIVWRGGEHGPTRAISLRALLEHKTEK